VRRAVMGPKPQGNACQRFTRVGDRQIIRHPVTMRHAAGARCASPPLVEYLREPDSVPRSSSQPGETVFPLIGHETRIDASRLDRRTAQGITASD
jgi:hypothetical protein